MRRRIPEAGLGIDGGTACGRIAGDDSTNAPGTGCTAEDLCAAGWHVCLSPKEFADRSGACNDALGATMFFASGSASNGNLTCTLDGGFDDIYGCGGDNLGTLLTGKCGDFNRVIGSGLTGVSTSAWAVGNDGGAERANVTKGPANGGVLCCKD